MSARTLRALWRNRNRIDARFRRDPDNRARFLQIFREPRGQTHELRRMNLYGILGHYLPAFGRIVGQMQHDLFHVYTVDEHILMVIRNLRRFTEPQHAHEYPLCSRLIADFERWEVLYLAGLFHDIAKGRGGDHSTLGERDARALLPRARACHARTPSSSAGSCREHLTMSTTAQKQDISDREVIAAFAAKVGSERRLTALYMLTVADIRGTSPRVWNAWKAQLLEDLFHATRRVLAGERRRAHAAGFAAAAAGRGVPSVAPLRGSRRTPSARCGGISTCRTSCGTRAEEIAWHARHLYWRVEETDAGRQGAPRAVRRGAAGAGVSARPESSCSRASAASSAAAACRSSKRRSTRRGTATRSTRSRSTIRPISSVSYRDTIQLIEFELTRAAAGQRRSSRRGRAREPAAQAFPALAVGADVPRRQGHALHPRDRRR